MAALIKICGITRQDDADVLAELGVDLAGFIFHPPSPRNIAPEAASAIAVAPARRVGVFVKQSVDEVRDIMHRARLDMAQLCGGQDPDFCRQIGPRKVLRVFWPERYGSRAELEAELALFADSMAYALLDAGTSGGGHGRPQDAAFLHDLQCPAPWLLAGGLSPQTLPKAMAGCEPDGFDLNSGLESAPGVKDAAKMRQAVALLRPKMGFEA